MKLVALLLVLLSIPTLALAQDTITTNPMGIKNNTLPSNATAPYYPDGFEAFKQYLAEKFENNAPKVDAKFTVSFIVEKDGKITNIIFPPEADETLKTLVTKTLSDCPPWVPGFLNGRLVRAKFTLPLAFHK